MNLYIVTGTTRGLGLALAERIARDPGPSGIWRDMRCLRG